MSKFVAVTFNDEAKAYEGTRALKGLHTEGSLTVYSMAVVARDANGNLSTKQAADTGPLGSALGALVGGLTGLLGGPVGATIGLGTGAMLGGMSDILNAGVGADFAKTMSDKLAPGKSAVIAEVDEDWVTPLDTRMEALGGVVMRERRSDFEDQQIEMDLKALKADHAQLRAELSSAKEERKANLKARMDEAQAKINAATERAKGRIQQLEQEVQAKTKELQDQAAKAKGEAKSKIDRHIAEIRTDYDRRSGMLKQARDLIREAVSS